MTTSQDLKEAFALLDSTPIKLGGNNPPNTASFVDDNPDNPVQICDSKGNQLLLMSLEDYEAARAWKPEVEVTKEGDTLVVAQITFPEPLNYLVYVAPQPNDELARLEAKAVDEILRGSILPAHMLQGAPFGNETPLPPPPARLLDPSLNTKDSK
jgi:hypothetical protein